MWSTPKFVCQLLILILLEGQSSAIKYKFNPENEDIFTDCPNKPSNVLNVSGLFDTSESTFKTDFVSVRFSGNLTCVWNIQPGDRIQVSFVLNRFDRGTWQPTVFSIMVPDLCSALYDEEQYWYKYWSKYIINKEQVKDKCILPGTKFIHETFDLDILFETQGFPLNGQHKLVHIFKAFGANGVERNTSICFEIIGEIQRL
ncbi:uncharacterized protein [Drosophila virilis]|uniref:CUB domain-containing protein n=1 Tax=Drosophila virilis TaxID=7244 RepID=B4LZH1_DROVI|nr:uncharacterized protein LOC6629617 [Drosophila virilis]EDW67110.1 uncharacterized protein Dvir_GJ23975 [Drosophila virilis]